MAGLLTSPETSEWLRVELAQRTSLGEKWALVLSGHDERASDADHLRGRIGLSRHFRLAAPRRRRRRPPTAA